jgi:hypothetical protein
MDVRLITTAPIRVGSDQIDSVVGAVAAGPVVPQPHVRELMRRRRPQRITQIRLEPGAALRRIRPPLVQQPEELAERRHAASSAHQADAAINSAHELCHRGLGHGDSALIGSLACSHQRITTSVTPLTV